jgi:hypothetical protein
MKKRISFLLVFLMVFAILAACGDTETDQGTGPNVPGSGDEITGDGGDANAEAERILADLPDANFGGHVFTVLAHREESDDWYAPDPREIILSEEQEADEPINDAVFRRNAVLQERFNIEFNMVTDTDEHNLLRRTVNAGDDVYDAVIIFNNHVSAVIGHGTLVNTDELPYIDLSKPWWDPGVNAMSVANKNFLLAGDLLILDNEATNALIFNKDLMQDLGLGLPYEMVKEGRWTFDAMEAMVRGAAADLNGDGVMTPDDDRWGFVGYNDTLHALLIGGSGILMEKDNDDLPVISFMSPKNLAIIDRAMDIMYNKAEVLNVQADISDGGTNSVNWLRAYHGAFETDRALFMWIRMRVVEKFRGMDSDFGIIPMPKFDEAQENYYSVVNAYTGVLMGVPRTASDLERTSIILEALSAESRYTLQPAYYDIVLQRKFARDEESEEMLDIIFGNRVYDIAGIYFQDTWLEFIRLCEQNSRQGDRNIASWHDRRQNTIQREIDRVIMRFEDMD